MPRVSLPVRGYNQASDFQVFDLPGWCNGYIQDGMVSVAFHEALDVENVAGENQPSSSYASSKG